VPINGLAPPDMPWLFTRPGQPNSLGPPALNYAAPPDAGGQTLGSAVADTGANAWQWLQDQREQSRQMGLLGDNGLPTQAGLVDAARATAEGVMMGTTAPGIRAYHGSPHSFEAFDTSKIGTGEGAQAYGHGLYFAEGEGVARQYRDVLASRSETNTPEGVAKFWANMQGGHEEGISHLEFVLRQIDQYPNSYPAGEADKINLAIQYLKSGGDLKPAGGHMYEVNIGADPEHFLHWDKPLSEQHPVVQEAIGYKPRPSYEEQTALLARLRDQGVPPEQVANHPDYKAMEARLDRSNILENGAPITSETPGSAIYRSFGDDPAAAAQALRDAGIPGIRYLDQGSRGAGQGTHNYVVFDAKTIDILRKYGIAGLIAGAGAAAAGTQQQPPTQ